MLKKKLIAEREALLAVAATGDAASAPVELDQSRVGRLSRMDALQAQAMNLETRRRREIKLARIESALLRLDDNTFGDCVRCSEPIGEKRLNLDPSLLLCISCAQAAEA